MKKAPLAIAALSLSLSTVQANETSEYDPAAMKAVKTLGSTLLNEVKGAIKQGGPIEAISACNINAIPLTEQTSNQLGTSISRTALRIRNPNNTPDAWERGVLEQFLERQAAGEPLKPMRYSEIVEQDGQRVYRMMKAIPVQKACLTCHGDNIKPEVAEKLDSLYPADQARGFKEGDLRGAFSVRKVL
jgi:hypothetical protein